MDRFQLVRANRERSSAIVSYSDPQLNDVPAPVAAYLRRLNTKDGRRVMWSALSSICWLLTGTHTIQRSGPKDWVIDYERALKVRADIVAAKARPGRDGYAPATINRHLAALRGVIRQCGRLKLMSYSDAMLINKEALDDVKFDSLLAGRFVPEQEIVAMVRACADRHRLSGLRDAAILCLLYGGGLRRTEAVTIKTGDYDSHVGLVRVLHAKHDRQREVNLIRGTPVLLNLWLQHRAQRCRYLLCPLMEDRAVGDSMLSQSSVYAALDRLSKQAGIKKVTPHDLRRSYVTRLLDAGNDLLIVQDLVGHRQAETTKRYDRRGEEARRKAALSITFPVDAFKVR